MSSELPLPKIAHHDFNGIVVLSDDSLFDTNGVRIAFTSRQGGVSKGAYSSLNLGNHVGDDLDDVQKNRSLILRALDVPDECCIFANQVHGDRVVVLSSGADLDEIAKIQSDAKDEADGILIGRPDVAALLCFADCVPVVIVSPTGAFAVVHAGWRGVMARIVPKAVELLSSDNIGIESADPSSFNVYIGPHIHSECFETSVEVRDRFVREFGSAAAVDDRHVDLSAALRLSLEAVGVSQNRILDVGICTKCNPDEYFSYRASGGTCGRHAAIAFRHSVSATETNHNWK